MRITLFVLMLILITLSGCMQINYEAPTGEKFTYERTIFDQKLEGLEVKKGDTVFKLNKQESSSDVIDALAKAGLLVGAGAAGGGM